jgi:hypothetical protein
MGVAQRFWWKEHRLYLGARLSGYSIVRDERYNWMWRVRRPDGSISDMVNRIRAKDAPQLMLQQDLNRSRGAQAAPGTR